MACVVAAVTVVSNKQRRIYHVLECCLASSNSCSWVAQQRQRLSTMIAFAESLNTTIRAAETGLPSSRRCKLIFELPLLQF